MFPLPLGVAKFGAFPNTDGGWRLEVRDRGHYRGNFRRRNHAPGGWIPVDVRRLRFTALVVELWSGIAQVGGLAGPRIGLGKL